MKKYIALLLFATMFFSASFISLPAAAAVQPVISNPGFEDGNENNRPSLWGADNKYNISLSDNNYKSGSKSLKLTTVNSGEANPCVTQNIGNIAANAEYDLSVWTKVESLDEGSRVAILLEYWGTYNNGRKYYIGTKAAVGTALHETADNKWTEITNTFVTPIGCDNITIYARLYGGGTAYFDDVSIKINKEPPKFSIETDWVFYYSDWLGEGTATVNVNTGYYSEFSTGSEVDFFLMDGNTSLLSDSVSVTDSLATFSFGLDKLSDIEKEYTIVAVLKDEGVIKETQTVSVYKYNRPEYIDDDLVYTKNGKRLDPFYGTKSDTSHYPLWSLAEANIVHGYYSDSLDSIENCLETAAANGLMVLLPLYKDKKPAGHEDLADHTRAVVERFKNHSALFGYSILDEPFLNGASESDMMNSYKIIHEIDKKHPVYSTGSLTGSYHKLAKYVDILGIDPYPEGNGDQTTSIGVKVELARQATEDKKPVYTILQAFDNNGYFPTVNELRNTFYQALWSGSKGIGLYGMARVYNGNDLNDTRLWQPIVSFSKKEKEIVYNHFINNTPILSEYKGEDYWSRTWNDDNKTFALIMNRSAESTALAEVNIQGLTDSHKIRILGGALADEGTISGNKISIELAPAQTVLYEISAPADNNEVFFTKNGFIIEELENGKLSACYHYLPDISGKMFGAVVLYNNDGVKKIEDIFILPANEYAAGQVYNLKLPFEINLTDDTYILKAFLWKSLDSAEPLTDALEIS